MMEIVDPFYFFWLQVVDKSIENDVLMHNECIILNRRAIILMMILYILLLASAHMMGSEKPNFPLIINGCETEVTNIDSHGVKRTISLPIFRFQC